MRPFALLLLTLVAASMLPAQDLSENIVVLQIDKQRVEPLTFWIRHAPEASPQQATETVKFRPLPDGVTAHLSEIGQFGGRRFLAIRYLSYSRLVHGNTGAIGLLILCSDAQQQDRFVPLIVEWDGGEFPATEDFSISTVKNFGDFFFFWVRRHYSGNSHVTKRIAVAKTDSSEQPEKYDLFDKTDPLENLQKAGWSPWFRGNFFEEDTLTFHFHLYRDVNKETPQSHTEHRFIRIPYIFRDGKLVPGKIEFEE